MIAEAMLSTLPFTAALGFDIDGAMIVEDDCYDYGEQRWQALGHIGHRLHVLVFTNREATIRVISLRRANAREVRTWQRK